MPATRPYHRLAAALVLLATQCALSQSFLTDRQFQASGAGEFLGTVLNVQVTSTYPAFEIGTVQLQVNHVIAGTLTASTINMPYQRAFVAYDGQANWDLIAPLGSSLKAATGQQLLVYFTRIDGKYAIYQASNSVQLVTSGLLLGSVESIAPSHGDSLDVEITVAESIHGWVKGPIVTLPYPRTPAASAAASATTPAALPFESLDANFSNIHRRDQFLISYANGTITGIQLAPSTILDQLKAANTGSAK